MSFRNTKMADVYLIAGQSNALGVSPCAGLPPDFKNNGSVMLYQSGAFSGVRAIDPAVCGRFIPVRPGLGHAADYFGLELGMAAALTDGAYLIKYACDGTSLYREWRPPSTGPLPAGFMPNYINPNATAAGAHYAGLIACVRNGLAELKRVYGLRGVLRGLAWNQGGSDALGEDSAATYGDNLTTFIRDVRAALDAPELPVAVGMAYPGGALKPYVQHVRAGQLKAAAALPRVVTVETLDLEIRADDPWHFSAASELELGTRFIEALKNNG